MSLIDQVVKQSGYDRADIVRVAKHGGVTDRDRSIAEAIAEVTGRKAETMMKDPITGERDRLKTVLYGEITTKDDYADLTGFASAAGADPEPLTAATGYIDTTDPDDARPGNPLAVHDPSVAIYSEDKNGIVTDHAVTVTQADPEPQTEDDEHEDQDTEPGTTELAHLLDEVAYADIAELLGDPDEAAEHIASWATAHQAHDGIKSILIRHASARSRARLIIDTLYAQAA